MNLDDIINKVPRRTNECWMGDFQYDPGLYVCGHKFLLYVEGSLLEIWKIMDGKHTAADIIDILCLKYKHDEKVKIKKDVVDCLLQLEKFGLAAWRTRPLFEDVLVKW